MGRIKGDGKGRNGGGRSAGTPNKTTGDLRKWIVGILEDGRENFSKSLNSLEPAEFVKVYTGLLNYVLPKQASINQDLMLEKERQMLIDLLSELPDEFIERVTKRLDYIQEKRKEYEN